MGTVVYRGYQGLAWVIFAAVLVQFFFAGIGIFGEEPWGEEAFTPHILTGLLAVPTSLVLLILAAVSAFTGNLRGRTVGMAALLFVLLIAQVLLGGLAQDISPFLAALHPVNALVLLGLSFHLARGRHKESAGEPATRRVR